MCTHHQHHHPTTTHPPSDPPSELRMNLTYCSCERHLLPFAWSVGWGLRELDGQPTLESEEQQ